MVKYIERETEREVIHYYDANPLEEDLVLESMPHADLTRYLVLVLQWLMREQPCTICDNLGFYQTFTTNEKPLAPDIALIKGVVLKGLQSWRIDSTGPPPHFVFEIASEETWLNDLSEKPAKYARMGVKEYVAYDPQTPPIKKRTKRRLYGWQLDDATGLMREMPLDADGRLWSPLLESFLVPDGEYLRLYDRDGYVRLTGEEAEARRADAEALAKEVLALAKLAETRRADAATRQAEEQMQRADAATRQAEQEAKAKEALIEKLRTLGIDPDQL